MGIRFGKRIKICDGVNLNLSSKGIGLSAGVKGFRISTGPTGTRMTTSIPGTGISYSNKIYAFSETIESKILNKKKTIKANSEWEFNILKQTQIRKWKEQEAKMIKSNIVKGFKDLASEKTEEVKMLLFLYSNILNHTLKIDDKLDWESQKQSKEYQEFTFQEKAPRLENFYEAFKVPSENKFLEFVFKSVKAKRIELQMKAKSAFDETYSYYLKTKEKAYNEYLIKKNEYEKNIDKKNKKIDDWKNSFERGEKTSVEKYTNVILSSSVYPDEFQREYEVDYLVEEKKMLVSLKVPTPDLITNVKEYKYSTKEKNIVAKEMGKIEFSSFYKSIIFQTVLRTVHEIFEGIYIKDILNNIALNLWVDTFNEATGEEEIKCILSLEVDRENFENINLAKVDVEECIKYLNARYYKSFVQLKEVTPYFELND